MYSLAMESNYLSAAEIHKDMIAWLQTMTNKSEPGAVIELCESKRAVITFEILKSARKDSTYLLVPGLSNKVSNCELII